MKRTLSLIASLLLLLLALNACGGPKEEQAATEPKPQETETTGSAIEEPEPIKILYPEPDFDQHFTLRFKGENLPDELYTIGNRAYICSPVVSEALEIDMEFTEEQLHWPAYQIEDRYYISLADADRLFDVFAQFNDSGTVALFRGHYDFKPVSEKSSEETKAAYIRLEDITADCGAGERFTHEKLEKLRVFGKYLGFISEGYYIAWIPKYVNPAANIVNDISKDLSFYNTDFVYTMDVLVDRGGRVGLHGLTHQRGDQISADGWEFDADAKLSAEEAGARMDEAIGICRAMGWDYHFFEFPHYGATGVAINEANKRFEVVYQQSPYAKEKGFVDGHKMEDGRTVWYVPTPADCLESEYGGDALINRMKRADSRGQVQSIFFHPIHDSRFMLISSDLYDRTYKIDEEHSILRKVAVYLDEAGEGFKPFDFM